MYFAGLHPNNDEIIHFIGIGGIGMSGIAEILYNLGFKVQGSDIVENNNSLRLSEKGIKIFIGHQIEHLHNVSYVVISSAINNSNVEMQEAYKLKIPVITRAEMLAELMRLKTSIAISGSHGKTTTTSLVAAIFEAAGLAPTVINGGIINSKSTNAYSGTGQYLIAEADESDATFINIPAMIAVITNIDPEHMDYYKDFSTLLAAFRQFITRLPFYGFAVVCIDHPEIRKLIGNIRERKIITYGIDSEDAHIQAFNIQNEVGQSIFDLRINLPSFNGKTIIENIVLPTPGRHNVLNALAAIAIGAELDFGIKVIKNGFKNFQGVKRRFAKVGEYNNVNIIDDYAHHPVEVMATLATARNIADKTQNRVIAVLQPHRYSRLKSLFEDFTLCFGDADMIYITDVYSAGEEKIVDFSGEILVKTIKSKKIHENIFFVPSPANENLPAILIKAIKPGDIIVMMGAGNITLWAQKLQNDFELLK